MIQMEERKEEKEKSEHGGRKREEKRRAVMEVGKKGAVFIPPFFPPRDFPYTFLLKVEQLSLG